MGLYKIQGRVYKAKDSKEALVQHKIFKDSLILVKCKDSYQNPKSFYITPMLKSYWEEYIATDPIYKNYNLENEVKHLYTEKFLQGNFGKINEQALVEESEAGAAEEMAGGKSNTEITGVYDLIKDKSWSRIVITYDPEEDETFVTGASMYETWPREKLLRYKDVHHEANNMTESSRHQRMYINNKYPDTYTSAEYYKDYRGNRDDMNDFIGKTIANDPVFFEFFKLNRNNQPTIEQYALELFKDYKATADDNKYFFRGKTIEADFKNTFLAWLNNNYGTRYTVPKALQSKDSINDSIKFMKHKDTTNYVINGEIDDGYTKDSFKKITDSLKSFGKLKSIKQGHEGKSLTKYTFIGTLQDCTKLLHYTEDETAVTPEILLSKSKSKMYDAVKYVKDEDEKKSSELEKLKKKLKDYSSIKEDGNKIRVEFKSAKELNAAMDKAKLWGREMDSSYDDAGKAWVIFEKEDLQNLK